MPDQKGLQRSNTKRTQEARQRALQAISELHGKGEKINFSTVSLKSGVSRHFLYEDSETRETIEKYRKIDVSNEMNRRSKFDKSSKSKDIVIAAKDRRIAKLEEENKKLRAEVIILRGMIYELKGTTSGTCTRREKS